MGDLQAIEQRLLLSSSLLSSSLLSLFHSPLLFVLFIIIILSAIEFASVQLFPVGLDATATSTMKRILDYARRFKDGVTSSYRNFIHLDVIYKSVLDKQPMTIFAFDGKESLLNWRLGNDAEV